MCRMRWYGRDPKQVALWWGPKGFTATIERGGPAPQVEMMATFAEEGKTRLTMRMDLCVGDEQSPMRELRLD